MSKELLRIAVTGAAGYIGRKLVKRLDQRAEVERVLALDILPVTYHCSDKVISVEQDINSSIKELLIEHEIQVIIHLAFILKPNHNQATVYRTNVLGTKAILTASSESEVKRIVYLSSTTVYGAHPDNPSMLVEEDIPRPINGFQYSKDKLAAEALIQSSKLIKKNLKHTILRACPVVGQTANNFISKALLNRVLFAVDGYDPPMQLLDEDDIAEVLSYCALNETSGIYNVAGDGIVHWSDIAKTLDRKLVRLPASLLYAVTKATWALRLQSNSPASGLNFVRYPWTVSTEKMKKNLDLTLRFSTQKALENFSLLEQVPPLK